MVECARLEIGCTARYRGFESRPLRHLRSCRVQPLARTNHPVELVVKEKEPEAKKPECILEECPYPETCCWNERCMEEGMRVSKKAKMAREKDIRRETVDESEK